MHHHTKTTDTHDGFSLVELSIVLVILGLLTGGILAGQHLIRAAEIRSLIEDSKEYQTAIYSFRDRYFALPGDLRNASDFWSSAIDGDGNGTINYNLCAVGEEYATWQHLALAGLISGTYTGSATSLPLSGVSPGAYRLSHQTDVYGHNGLMLSLNRKDASGCANSAILTPDETYSIDVKLDDGKADQGNVLGFNEEGVTNCITNDYTAGSGDYILTNTDKDCKVFFVFR